MSVWQNAGQKLFYFKILMKIFPICKPLKVKVVTHYCPAEKDENCGKDGSWFVITPIKIAVWGNDGCFSFSCNISNCACHNNFVDIFLGLLYCLEKLSILERNFLAHNMLLNLKNLSKDRISILKKYFLGVHRIKDVQS